MSNACGCQDIQHGFTNICRPAEGFVDDGHLDTVQQCSVYPTGPQQYAELPIQSGLTIYFCTADHATNLSQQSHLADAPTTHTYKYLLTHKQELASVYQILP